MVQEGVIYRHHSVVVATWTGLYSSRPYTAWTKSTAAAALQKAPTALRFEVLDYSARPPVRIWWAGRTNLGIGVLVTAGQFSCNFGRPELQPSSSSGVVAAAVDYPRDHLSHGKGCGVPPTLVLVSKSPYSETPSCAAVYGGIGSLFASHEF